MPADEASLFIKSFISDQAAHELGASVFWTRPACGFIRWVPIGELAQSGRAFARQLSHEKKALVSPGELFGAHGEKHIRLSFAAEDGRLREGVSRLVNFVRGKQAVRQERWPNAA
jgi:aspartate/methionine/tyrosine aminotransferase